MNRRLLLGAVVCVLAVVALLRVSGSSDGWKRGSGVVASTVSGGAADSDAATRVDGGDSSPGPIRGPDPKTYERERRAHPHRLPPALSRFAREMAPRMREALGSPDRAHAEFARLEGCADDPAGRELLQVRAICAVNAGRLARAFGDRLGGRYARLVGRLPEPVALWVRASGF